MDSIIASKNITDETTINFLMELAKSRNAKKGDDVVETSTNSTNEVHSTLSLDGYDTKHEFMNENEGGEE